MTVRLAVERALTPEHVESAIKRRDANVYAGFLVANIRRDMAVLDCGCGQGTITLGLARAVPEGQVVGIDLGQRDLSTARRYAATLSLGNLSWIAADGRRIPFCDAQFDAVLCHSMLETADDPDECHIGAAAGHKTWRPSWSRICGLWRPYPWGSADGWTSAFL